MCAAATPSAQQLRLATASDTLEFALGKYRHIEAGLDDHADADMLSR